jgi:hypothetical protein
MTIAEQSSCPKQVFGAEYHKSFTGGHLAYFNAYKITKSSKYAQAYSTSRKNVLNTNNDKDKTPKDIK